MIRRIALHLLLIVLAAVAVLPFIWLICAAFKTPQDLFGSTLLPWRHLDRLTLNNFRACATSRSRTGWSTPSSSPPCTRSWS